MRQASGRTPTGTPLRSRPGCGRAGTLTLATLRRCTPWVATLDRRTRDSHCAAHGQTVAMDQPFVVGGARLMYPRLPRRAARETVQCRCTMVVMMGEPGRGGGGGGSQPPEPAGTGPAAGAVGGGSRGRGSRGSAGPSPAGRDEFTARHWNQREIQVVVHPRARGLPSVGDLARALFARELPALEWASLVGAPDGARVDVLSDSSDYGPVVHLRMAHPWLEGAALRYVYRDPEDRVAIRNELLIVRDEAPEGVGVRLLALQVRAARALGLAYLSAYAAGGPGSPFVGYSVWPRLGYNGPIPSAVRRRLPLEYQDARDLLDLLVRPGGAVWWRRHGTGFEATFDLGAGSRSLAVLAAYMERRGIRL